MPVWLVAILVVAYLAAPVVELRLWRAGRLSDRAVAVLLLTRFPVLLGVMWLAAGVHLDTLVIIVPVVIVIWKIGYGWLLSDLRDRGGELRSARS
ncbi:MAG TPA: hypothetical protein VHM48_02825 [Candidatus Limnocylindrales bacterium]|nr:hypothetical protein [Candidatus Limnocylindrales bacterium]